MHVSHVKENRGQISPVIQNSSSNQIETSRNDISWLPNFLECTNHPDEIYPTPPEVVSPDAKNKKKIYHFNIIYNR